MVFVVVAVVLICFLCVWIFFFALLFCSLMFAFAHICLITLLD